MCALRAITVPSGTGRSASCTPAASTPTPRWPDRWAAPASWSLRSACSVDIPVCRCGADALVVEDLEAALDEPLEHQDARQHLTALGAAVTRSADVLRGEAVLRAVHKPDRDAVPHVNR